MTKLGIGLIGCGVMGASLARSCNELEHASVMALADVVSESRDQLADELGTVQFRANDYHELRQREDVAAVLVSLPGFMHAEITIAAARAGKHVFVEKPMALSLQDCDAMISACATANVKLMVGHVCRYHAVHSKVKQLVEADAIGAPACMTVRRLGGGWAGVWKRDWRLERAKSGGALLEVNAHEIDFMRWVCGDVASVVARGGRYTTTPQDYEDTMLVTLGFASGALGLLHSSNGSALGDYGGRLDGSEGSVVFDKIWGDGAGIRYGRFGEEPTFIPTGEHQIEPPVRAELRAFVDATVNDTEPPITGSEGRAVVEIALAAYASATGKKEVKLIED